MRKQIREVKTLEWNNLASVWCCVENIVVAMAEEWLYGCTCSHYNTVDLKNYLEMSPDMEIVAFIPIGYPKKQPEERSPEDLDARLHVDEW